MPLSVEHERSVSAAPSISHLNRVRNRNRYVGRAQAAPPAPLGAVGPWTEAGGPAMDVAIEGDEASQQGGASAEGDGAVQMGTVGVGLEGMSTRRLGTM